MKKSKSGWEISDLAMENGATAGVAPSPGRSTASPRKRTKARKKRKKILVKNSLRVSSFNTLLVAVFIFLFIVSVGILVQHSIISQLDSEVNTLQSTLNEQRSLNDSKEGQLVTRRDYTQIEATARSYGMTEATADQQVTQVVTPQVKSTDPIAHTQGWLEGIFKH